MRLIKQKVVGFVIFLTALGALLHFYNLDWGSPFYFHPDERNIASSVSQLQFPNQMNPHFFAYGSLPIYIIYFTTLLINFFLSILQTTDFELRTNFEQAIFISRFYSAIFATLLIPILFFIGKKLKNEKTGLLAAFLTTTSVGFIQFSHFGTFEMWLTFFSVLLFWVCLQKTNYKTILFMGVIFGSLISIKISSFVLLPILLVRIILKSSQKKFFLKLVIYLPLFSVFAFLIYFLTNPFVFLDTLSFKNSINYESSLALGMLPVFYTGEFFNTTPIIFQFLHIYPFLLNPLITILFIISSIYIIFKAIKTQNSSYYLLFAICYLLFFSQAFLFAKWARYMVPTLPFVYLIIAIAVMGFLHITKKVFSIKYLVFSILVFINILFAVSYFITAFVRQDTRLAAREFAIKKIPSNAQILSEVYDMGIVPFNSNFSNIILFNFYDLDNNSPDATPEILKHNLDKSDYIVLPSQRIFKTRLLNEDKFPQGNMFYKELINEKLAFKKIYETPCDIFCKIIYLGDPIFSFEQTANVFDRPTIMIFKKL